MKFPLTETRGGFTLVELLVVVGLIAMIMAAFTSSVSAATERTRVQRATSDVKSLTQAILGYENHAKGYELPVMRDQDVGMSSLPFLFGKGGQGESGNDIPVLMLASLQKGGNMVDPWGTPYKVSIQKGNIRATAGLSGVSTGYMLPNFWRLSNEERQ